MRMTLLSVPSMNLAPSVLILSTFHLFFFTSNSFGEIAFFGARSWKPQALLSPADTSGSRRPVSPLLRVERFLLTAFQAAVFFFFLRLDRSLVLPLLEAPCTWIFWSAIILVAPLPARNTPRSYFHSYFPPPSFHRYEPHAHRKPMTFMRGDTPAATGSGAPFFS